MCLILFGFKVSRKYPLVLAANRDEFYQRPTAPMHFWKPNQHLLAGKDLEQGGTWFGVAKNGRFAALTNFRDPASIKPSAPSRGEIITQFLSSTLSVESYGDVLEKSADAYNGYNLLLGSKEELFWFSSVKKQTCRIDPGVHGLSNHHLDSPWPKVETGKELLKDTIQRGSLTSDLFFILNNQKRPEDHALPDTGVGIEWERRLSPLFIRSHTYGTRSSTIMTIDTKGLLKVHERTYEKKSHLVYTDKRFLITLPLV